MRNRRDTRKNTEFSRGNEIARAAERPRKVRRAKDHGLRCFGNRLTVLAGADDFDGGPIDRVTARIDHFSLQRGSARECHGHRGRRTRGHRNGGSGHEPFGSRGQG